MTDPSPFVAEYLDGQSLSSIPVELYIGEESLQIVGAGQRVVAAWDYVGLACDAMQDGNVLHVSHVSDADASLVVREGVCIRVLLGRARQVRKLPGGPRKLRAAVFWMAAVVALGVGTYLGVPAFARIVAHSIPLAQERALGTQVALLLDMATCQDAPAEAPLGKLLNALSAQPHELRIIDDGMPNAFALPGGIIMVTDGLLARAEGPDEVAGVLAHELEHIAQRHVLTGVVRDTLLSAAWSLTVGDYAGLMAIDPSTAYRVATLRFSREDEAAADRGAVRRLHQAGLSHQGLISFFVNLEDDHGAGKLDWLSSHPSTNKRIRVLRETQDVAEAHASLSDAEFIELKRGCGLEEREPPPDASP